MRVGHYLYGEPLTAFEVIDRDWCSRCAGTAHNIYYHWAEQLERRLGREPEPDEIRRVVAADESRRAKGDRWRHVLGEVGDRSRAALLAEMEAAVDGVNLEEYVEELRKRGR